MSVCGTRTSPNLDDAAASPTSPIHQTILEVESQLSILDQEIAQLGVRSKMVKDERRRVQRHLGIHRAALAPIRRLPSELLSYIFELCLAGSSHPGRYHSNAAPSLFLQVNRQWRTLALSTSRLWGSLNLFAFALSNSKQVQGEASWAKIWLERSGSSPLFLDIDSDAHFFSGITTHTVIDTVVPHAHRIKELSISLSSTLYSALTPMKGCLSSLQNLTIFGFGHSHCPGPYDVFAVAPALRTLNLIGRLPVFELPLSQLTSCQFGGYAHSIHQIHKSLRQMPNLESLNLSSYLGMGNDIPSATPIVSPIRSLTLVATSEHYLEKLWGPLVLPNLRAIDISLQGTFSAFWPSVMSLLDRSSCRLKLESFECTMDNMDEGALGEFLSTTPLLNKLAIRDHNSSKEELGLGDLFLSRLQVTTSTMTSSPGGLVPNLQSLSLSGTFTFDDDIKLADMIESRWRPRDQGTSQSEPGSFEGACLRHVDLQLFMEVSQQTIRRLQELRRQGLDLKLRLKY